MQRHGLTDDEWAAIEGLLPSGMGRPPKAANRDFLNAVLWKVRTGVPWRDLPRDYGPWETVYGRFRRWAVAGHFERIFAALRIDVDEHWHSIDGTYVRAHQHAAGGKGGLKKTP